MAFLGVDHNLDRPLSLRNSLARLKSSFEPTNETFSTVDVRFLRGGRQTATVNQRAIGVEVPLHLIQGFE